MKQIYISLILKQYKWVGYFAIDNKSYDIEAYPSILDTDNMRTLLERLTVMSAKKGIKGI